MNAFNEKELVANLGRGLAEALAVSSPIDHGKALFEKDAEHLKTMERSRRQIVRIEQNRDTRLEEIRIERLRLEAEERDLIKFSMEEIGRHRREIAKCRAYIGADE